MRIVDFAKQRGADPDTITRYMKRHPEPFEGHISFDGNKMVVDEVAVKVLEEKYPLPAPVEVIKDTRSQELLIQEQQKVAALQEQLMAMKDQIHTQQLQIAKQEGELLRLEDGSKRTQEENDGLKKQMGTVQDENDGLKKKIDEQTGALQQQAADLATAKTSLEYTERALEEEKGRVAAAEEELARMKAAGWWKRLRGKW